MATVHMLTTKAAFDNAIIGAETCLVYFTATWCGPCRMIGPAVERLAKEFTNISFFKVDVDDNAEAAQHCGIECMPTFILFKGGTKADELLGASEPKLRELLEKQ